jgi:3-mercaptopyruvate sulfurtransferase SseA
MVRLVDMRDCAALLALSVASGMLSLGLRAQVPWLAPEPDVVVAACSLDESDAISPMPVGRRTVQRIAVDEMLARLADGGVTVIDARPGAAYVTGHIPGAISLPAEEAAGILATQTLPIHPDHLVVTYCDDDGSDATHVMELLGASVGCRQVRLLDGGWPAWVDAGAPVEDERSG